MTQTGTAPMDQAVAGSDAASRRITILGASGSIGQSTLDLVARAREADPGAYPIAALTAYSNLDRLVSDALQFRPDVAVIGDESLYSALKTALAGSGVEAAAGAPALEEAADRPADWVMAAIVGAAGLPPTLAAARRGAHIALANKECLVCAGPVFLKEVAASGARLLPVDSEHNAMFQVLEGQDLSALSRLILTASGGPFRTWAKEAMAAATPAEAVAHPNWDMGAKISVDSASMMNKGLELIEAHHLFQVPESQIDIVVHPQSIVHSLVEYTDGSVLAQLGSPDMRTPIAYTLAWPRRMPAPAERLDLPSLARLDFEAPDPERFPALRLARDSLQTAASAPTLLNAANEVAVAAFLEERVGFLDIPGIVEETLDRGLGELNHAGLTSLDDVVAVDGLGRRFAHEAVGQRSAS